MENCKNNQIVNGSNPFNLAEREPREYLNSFVIYNHLGTVIEYTGERLEQRDWDVLNLLICERESDGGQSTDFNPLDIIEKLRLPRTEESKELLLNSMKRLSACSFFIVKSTIPQSAKRARKYGYCTAAVVHPITSFSWDKSQSEEELRVDLDERIGVLLSCNLKKITGGAYSAARALRA
jgi:hypothetical protein